MLSKVLLFALLGTTSASFLGTLKDEAKKFLPASSVERFSIDLPGQERNAVPPVREAARGLMTKLQSALLIHGAPLGSFKAGDVLSHFGYPQHRIPSSGRRLKLGSYSIANCSSPSPDKAKFVVRSLSITPDPVELPGTLTFSFDIDVLMDIASAEVNVDMKLTKGSTTVDVPCLGGQIGSCDYKDICSLLSQVQSCPPEFDAAKIPCKCPFPKGSYKLPEISVEIDAEVFVSGDYNVTAKSTSGGDFLGCYVINFSISD
ncbi:hypothetical protein BaRGS_00012326 [Batillaria attramentaria]|uniref:MD-2-related lipid-recognition domain-containing protein n=1 Tax=Batillaria attramentaria TaxID=370345 RepID=A0ABD0LB97_9CAEN